MKDVIATIRAVFEKISRVQATFLAMMITMFFFIYLIMPGIINHLEISDERLERRAQKEAHFKSEIARKMDSIQRLQKITENELFIVKNNKINDLMSYLERRFPSSSHISIFSVHNGGGVPKTGSEAKMSVLYTTDNVRGVNLLKDYENYPLYPGYAELCYQMLIEKGSPLYIEDVAKYPNIYKGETAANMDLIGTKSLLGMWIKSSPTSTYYIIAAFDQVYGLDGLQSNFPKATIINARLKLIELIDVNDHR